MTEARDDKMERPKRRGSFSGLVWTVVALTIANMAYWVVYALSLPHIILWVPLFVLGTEMGPFGFLVLTRMPYSHENFVEGGIIAVVLLGLATLPLWLAARGAGRICLLLLMLLCQLVDSGVGDWR